MVNPPPRLDQIVKGIEAEKQHTRDLPKREATLAALKIVLDHLKEDPNYYDKLKKAGLEEVEQPIGLVPGSGGEGGGDNQTNSKPKGGEEKSTGSKIDTAGEFIKQLNNIRTMISNGKIKLDTKEIQLTSKILDKLANLANQSSAGPTFDRLQKYLDNLSQSLTGGNDNK
jgi:hypothetical protein